jgi:hypothetical protein
VDALTDLLRGNLADELREIDELDELIREGTPVLVEFFFDEESGWPYDLVAAEAPRRKGFSQSTTAMVAFALAALSGGIRESQLIAAQPQIGSFFGDEQSDNVVNRAIAGLVSKLHADRQDGAVRTTSGTFGSNDPFTLHWILELLSKDLQHRSFRDGVALTGFHVARDALSHPGKPVLKPLVRGDHETFTPVVHTLPLLRVVQMAKLLEKIGQDPDVPYQEVRDHFFNQLHQQISYSEIKDSAFDVAELVFALEGVLACDPEAVNEAVLERSLEVIRHVQEINPNWRPLRPFRTNPQGGVQAPVSIEVALSLLRVVDLADRHRPTARSFASNRGVFRRYTEWLRSTRVVGKVRNRQTFRGWQSEHAYSTIPMMHLWETSQVLLYLFNYRTLLRRHLAAAALEAAGFSMAAPRRELGEPRDVWSRWEQGEPLSGLEPTSPYRVYASIRRSFVGPHAEAGASGPDPRARYSFLIYGPPGTGKTSVAEKLAASLSWRLLTITTSDFVILGEAQVEARAKAIFEVLQLQTDCVILFDEIDRLLLDRDSIDYRAQGDLFQLMTPSMLTKLNNLRRWKRVIFIISTNYADRIDSAITRPGRIDAHYLLLPPNFCQRTRILYRRLSKSATLKVVGRSDRRAVAKKTALYSWTELQRVVERAEELIIEQGVAAPEALEAACFDVQPTIQLSTYIKRVNDAKPGPPDRLLEELFLLSYLEAEVKTSPDLSTVDLETLKSHWADRRELARDNHIRDRLDVFLG